MISKKARSINPSVTLNITAKAREMRNSGIEVINFAAGEPDFPVFDNIKEKGIEAIQNNFTKYTPTAGILELKQAIVDKFKRDNCLEYSADCVMVANGAKQILFNTFMALTEENDEFLVMQPYWVSYVEQIKLAGGKPVFVEGIVVAAKEIAKKITEKTKAIVLNSPCNPTGAVISKEELEKIAKLAVEHNIYVISDEVYEYFVYNDSKHHSIASFSSEIKKKTITINAVSKSFAMTGLRLGYCGAPKEIITAMTRIQDHATSGPCSITQKMATEALKLNPSELELIKTEFEEKKNYIVEKFREMGLECTLPEGTFYAFPLISNTGLTSMEFCAKLLEKEKVAIVPGKAFGDDKYVRVSFACSFETVKKGMEKIKRFVEELK